MTDSKERRAAWLSTLTKGDRVIVDSHYMNRLHVRVITRDDKKTCGSARSATTASKESLKVTRIATSTTQRRWRCRRKKIFGRQNFRSCFLQ